jgi:hypothetical protein
MSQAARTKPTPEQVDELVEKMAALVAAQAQTAAQYQAGKDYAKAKAEALALVAEFGETPDKAPASKRLTGTKFALTATTATQTTEHPEVVAQLLAAMRKNRQEGLFMQLFTPSTRYDRAKDAVNTLRNAKLPARLRTLFDDLFAKSTTETKRAPVLRVDELKPCR